MNIAQIRKLDVANGPGLRVTMFVSGCYFDCYNCFNKEYQDFDYGESFSFNHFTTIVKELEDPKVAGLSILGGEPLEHSNILKYFLEDFKYVMRPSQTIWMWTGYTFEDILKDKDMYLTISQVDVLVDGLFIQAKKDLSLKFRGSSNQRIIDVQKSLELGEVVLWE